MNGTDSVTSDLCESCFYFEQYEQTNDKINMQLKGVVSEGRVVSDTMLIIIKFLIATIFCQYEFLCENLYT